MVVVRRGEASASPHLRCPSSYTVVRRLRSSWACCVSNGGDAGSGVAVLGDVQVVVMQSACGDLKSKVVVVGVELGGEVYCLFLVCGEFKCGDDDDDEELVGCVVLGVFAIFFLAGAEFAAVSKTQVVWSHFWWCEEVSVGLQRLGSIRSFSSDSTTLLSGGLSMWIDGVAVVKVNFVVALVVVVAKVDSWWLLLFQSL
ncbi:transmembrane protein, putative [Medicago truncatula]|uniref:Transmembrane protein, putative n=1 Tax=Medicago truncatula TaxID=3880 RepID=A0A072UJ08_MEDTR|nr:transmembrane protein, putative [Medicago truncatula]